MIVLEILKEDAIEFENEIENLTENGAIAIKSKAFQGAPEMIQLLVELTPAILATVTTISVTCIKAKKHISIKHNGIEISGISEKNALKIFEELMKNDNFAKIELNNSNEENEKNKK